MKLPTAIVGVLAAAAATEHPPCPAETFGLKSATSAGGKTVNFEWESEVPFDVVVYWVNFEGRESPAVVLAAGEKSVGGTFPGHSFRVRTYKDELLAEVTVPETPPHRHVVRSCAGISSQEDLLLPPGKAEEFAALVHDQDAPCVGPSRDWSCIRKLTKEEYLARGTEGYGFLPNETTPDRVGMQNDESYVRHIAAIPRVSAFGPGFLKMTMPAAIRDVLLPWYNATKHEQTPHEIVPGGYMNENQIKMNRLNLDHYPEIRNLIVKEMKLVLQWWTQMRLKHASTYGIRIYRRGAMLINHVDRGDSHLASAVMQVAQDVDEDGGWPLEVMLGNQHVGEVYLQPGEIVLYEGAWLRHGRPMRFKGNEFANIFTHYQPFDWSGPPDWNPDTNKPLPPKFHGYVPWRCQTIVDEDAAAPSACQVTDVMESEWKAKMTSPPGMEVPAHRPLTDEL